MLRRRHYAATISLIPPLCRQLMLHISIFHIRHAASAIDSYGALLFATPPADDVATLFRCHAADCRYCHARLPRLPALIFISLRCHYATRCHYFMLATTSVSYFRHATDAAIPPLD